MGIVSVIAVVIGIAFFLSASKRINAVAEEEGDENISWALRWGARFAALAAICGVVGVVDAYIYDLPSPFQAPEADLPDKPEARPPAERPEIREAPKPDPMGDAREGHGKAMDDFEKRREDG